MRSAEEHTKKFAEKRPTDQNIALRDGEHLSQASHVMKLLKGRQHVTRSRVVNSNKSNDSIINVPAQHCQLLVYEIFGMHGLFLSSQIMQHY